MFPESDVYLRPTSFFALRFDCHHCEERERLPATHLIPSTASLTGDASFASVRAGWSEEGLAFRVDVHKKVERCLYPQIDKGDAVELFIDTRDVKTSGYNTRYCHHFFFLPQEVDGKRCGELTHFRTDDRHSLCDPDALSLEVVTGRRSYEMHILISSDCLVGYDPHQFRRFGFSYRVHRAGGEPMHFAAHGDEYQMGEQPSLWATANMV